MAGWFLELPALLIAFIVIFLPGMILGWLLRMRGLALWASAPVISTAVLTCLAFVLGLFGIGWYPGAAAVSFVVVAGIVALLFLVLRARPMTSAPSQPHWFFGVGVSIGVVLTLLRVGALIGPPNSVSQTNDGMFHLNALRFAVETGSASPLKLAGMLGGESFYPSAWHVLAALVAQISGSEIAVAANAVTLVLAAVVWPLGIAWLTRICAGDVAAGFAAALSASVASFPLALTQWGVLYPQLIAVAILPAAIAVFVARARLWRSDARAAGAVRFVLLFLAAGIALALAQPSVLLVWFLAVALVWAGSLISRRKDHRPGAGASVAGLILWILATAVLWWFFSRSLSLGWPPVMPIRVAVAEALGNGFLGYPWAVLTSILMLIGLVVAIRSRAHAWLAVFWVALAGLFIIAAAFGNPTLRQLAVGAWYEDPYRLAALVPVAVLPLAGWGAAWLVPLIAKSIIRKKDGRGPSIVAWSGLGAVLVIGIVGFIVAPVVNLRDAFSDRAPFNPYAVTEDSFLSGDELAILERLEGLVPARAVVIGNPGTGASFGYAISGREVLPKTWNPPAAEAYDVLRSSLRDVSTNPAVCPALEAFGAEYVLDFGPGEAYPGRWVMPGFTDLESRDGFELVKRIGDASLWRVTACA